MIPRSWKVIQVVREKFTYRDCERIHQPLAPFHVTPHGWARPNLLAMIMFEKFGQHQPLNRQTERYEFEVLPLSLSALADQVGACTVALMPLLKRLHGDDTTVPLLAEVRSTSPVPGFTCATITHSTTPRHRRWCFIIRRSSRRTSASAFHQLYRHSSG